MFWVGTSNNKKMPYGTIQSAPMFVQYLEPAQPRHPLPVVLVHGGGGQMVHYMGLGGHVGLGASLRAGGLQGVSRRSSRVTVDRSYHPDALGEIGPLVTYDLLTRDTRDVGACTEQTVAWHDG